VADGGLRWVAGGGGVEAGGAAGFASALGLVQLHEDQRGLLDDMDAVADALYERGAGTAGGEA